LPSLINSQFASIVSTNYQFIWFVSLFRFVCFVLYRLFICLLAWVAGARKGIPMKLVQHEVKIKVKDLIVHFYSRFTIRAERSKERGKNETSIKMNLRMNALENFYDEARINRCNGRQQQEAGKVFDEQIRKIAKRKEKTVDDSTKVVNFTYLFIYFIT
jgi:hypothetical protein